MAEDRLIQGYADALFTVADAEGALPAVEEELYAFARALEQNTKLREALTDTALPAENKRTLVAEVLGDRANPVTVTLLGFVIDAGHAKALPKIANALAERAAAERQHRVAEVRTAVPLSDEQRDRLAAALGEATNSQVDVKVVIDPSVVGGVVARVGDEVFDGSIRSRLVAAKQRLGSAHGTES